VDGAAVRLGVLQGAFHWHRHEQQDELFLVLKGGCRNEPEGREAVELAGGTATARGWHPGCLVRLGGALADRFGPARVAALGYAVQGVATVAIIVAAQQGSVVGICIAVGFGQAAGALSAPCEGALVPLIASPERLGGVNSLRSIG
jgi:hypothetical protein